MNDVAVDRPTQLIHIGISICQHTSTKDIAGQSAKDISSNKISHVTCGRVIEIMVGDGVVDELPERCECEHDGDVAHVARVLRRLLLVFLLVTVLIRSDYTFFLNWSP